MIFFGPKVSSMQKCSVGTPADLGFYNLILKCGNSHKPGCNKFDFESVGTTANRDFAVKLSIFKISCPRGFGSLYLNILFFQVFRQE